MSLHSSAVFPISDHIYVGDGALDVPISLYSCNYPYPFRIFLLSPQHYLSRDLFLANLNTTPAIASTAATPIRQIQTITS